MTERQKDRLEEQQEGDTIEGMICYHVKMLLEKTKVDGQTGGPSDTN